MRKIFLQLIFIFSSTVLFSQNFCIKKFGAKGDGKTSCTQAIQSAIDAAHQKGGGKVMVPKGEYVTGSFFIKSNVELHLEKGATLLGEIDQKKYTKIGYWHGLILADGQENFSITGTGEIDGRGRELSLRLDSLFHAGELDSVHYNFVELRPKYTMRPTLIQFINSKKIKVKNITLKNAAGWVQNYEQCENIEIENIRVESDAFWNNDGIDIVDCKNVSLKNSYFNSSDDGICLKSHSAKHLCENITIDNCTVRSSASAVKFGTKSMGGFRNVTITNIKVFDTFRSAIAIESVEGGILENVLIENFDVKNTGNAIFIKLGHRRKNKTTTKSTLKNIIIRNMKAEIAFERPDYKYEVRGPALPFFHNTFPASITGYPNHPIENVTLENIEIIYPGRGNKGLKYMPLSRLDDVPENEEDYPEFSMFGELPAWGFYVRHVDGLKFNNVKLSIQAADYRHAFVFDDVKNLEFKDLEIKGEQKKKHIVLYKTENAKIENQSAVLKLK